MKRVYLKYIQETIHLTTDIDEYIKATGHEISEDYVYGSNSGNCMYINLKQPEEELIYTCMHEVSHYLDWLFENEFKVNEYREVSELRARYQQEITREIYKQINKIKNNLHN